MRIAPTESNDSLISGDSYARDLRPEIRAWAAVGHIDLQGRRCDVAAKSSLCVVALCINESYPLEIVERIELMTAAVHKMAHVLEGKPSLWVYPAGYFGFDASEYARGNKAAAWPGVNVSVIQERLAEIVDAHPRGAWVAFGVDTKDEQQAWVVRGVDAGSGATLERHTIQQNDSSLENHCVELVPGGLRAAFFVCAEITSYEDRLSSCRVVVDLAHVHVPGTVWSNHEGWRMMHQGALTKVAAHGAAVLTHHHAGQYTKAGHPRYDQQSNWILFRGKGTDWLDSKEVVEIP